MERHINIPIIISLTLIILMSLIGFYAINMDLNPPKRDFDIHPRCERFQFSILNNRIVCEGYRGVESDTQGNIFNPGKYVIEEYKITDLYLMPFLILSSMITIITFYFCFFRFSHFSLISNNIGTFYNNACRKDIKKESYFLGVFLFVYLFILIGIWFLIGLMFSVNYEKLTSIWTYIQMLIYSLSIAVPIAVSIYFGKKWLNSPTPKKAFLKSPLSTIIPSLLFVILIELYIGFFTSTIPITGEPGFFPILWLLFSPIYVLGIALTSLLLTSYLYYYSHQRNRTILKLVMAFLLCVPYLLTFIGMMI